MGNSRIQFRRDTKARWAEVNPVLMEGEVGLEIDTQNIKMGDGEHAWNDLEYGVGYSNVTNEPGNSENLAISQKGVTELVRGIKDGMTASEYPTIRIEDFAVGVTETGSDRTAKVLEKFNTWLNAVDFSLSGKYIGHCIVGLDGRNGDVCNYLFSHENKYGVQVIMGGYGIKSDGTIYNVDGYKIIYRVCNNRTTGEWIDYSTENIVDELGDSESLVVNQRCVKNIFNEIKIKIDKLGENVVDSDNIISVITEKNEISVGTPSEGYYLVEGTSISSVDTYGKKYNRIDISKYIGKNIVIFIKGDQSDSVRYSAITDESGNVIYSIKEKSFITIDNGVYMKVFYCDSMSKYLYISHKPISNLLGVYSINKVLNSNSTEIVELIKHSKIIDNITSGLIPTLSNSVEATKGVDYTNSIDIKIPANTPFILKISNTEGILNNYFIYINNSVYTSVSKGDDFNQEIKLTYDITNIKVIRNAANVIGTGAITMAIKGFTTNDLIKNVNTNTSNISILSDKIKEIDENNNFIGEKILATLSENKYYTQDSITPSVGSGYYTEYANAINVEAYRGKYFYIQSSNIRVESVRSCLLLDNSDNIIAHVMEKEMQDNGMGVYIAKVYIPMTASKLLVSYSKTMSNVKLLLGEENIKIPTNLVYVNPQTGNDKNNGSKEYPLATFKQALLNTGEYTNIIFTGISNEVINIKTKQNQAVLRIFGKYGAVNRIDRGIKYKAAIIENSIYKIEDVSLPSWSKGYNLWIFQEGIDDVDTLIEDSERMPMQRGKEYRCENTAISRVNTLEEVTTESFKYYYDDVNRVLYFHAPSDDFENHPIVIPSTDHGISGNDGSVKVEICNVEFSYCNANFSYCHNAVVRDCKVGYCFSSGAFAYNLAVGIEFVRCEALRTNSGTANGDGFNAHAEINITEFGNAPVFSKHVSATLTDCWSHDNNDDGYSDHERSETVIKGGLYEFNGKGGITPSYGSHCSCYDVIARHNYNGFNYVGDVKNVNPPEGGKYGQMLCVNCIALDNTRGTSTKAGFAVDGNGNRLILKNCLSKGNDVGYRADVNTNIEMYDCKVINCIKNKDGGGNIEVFNSITVD